MLGVPIAMHSMTRSEAEALNRIQVCLNIRLQLPSYLPLLDSLIGASFASRNPFSVECHVVGTLGLDLVTGRI